MVMGQMPGLPGSQPPPQPAQMQQQMGQPSAVKQEQALGQMMIPGLSAPQQAQQLQQQQQQQQSASGAPGRACCRVVRLRMFHHHSMSRKGVFRAICGSTEYLQCRTIKSSSATEYISQLYGKT